MVVAAPPRPATRIAFVLIDGIGDVSIPSLGNKTPLQAARTPNLDAIASAGVNGLMDPVEPGLACGSDTAHLSLLGYDPRLHYRGRGAFESMGAGIPMSPGDIAFKSNFATVDDSSGIVTTRRADRHFEEDGPILSRHLDGIAIPGFPQHQVSVKYATEHRCGVVIRGPGLSDRISATDPLKDGRLLGVAAPLDDSPEAVHTAAVVNALSNAIRGRLRGHVVNEKRVAAGKNPANVVLLRGCGIRIEVPSFFARHSLRAAMVAPTKIIAGLGLSLGVDVLHVPQATGDYRTSLAHKAEAAAAALCNCLLGAPAPAIAVPGEDKPREGRMEGYEFAFLHVKAIDDAGHDKNVALKVRGLEAADRMVGQLARRLWEARRQVLEGNAAGGNPAAQPPRFLVCVTGDHSTPVEYGDHAEEPVPLAVCDLEDYVRVRGEEEVLRTPLEPFPFPSDREDGGKAHESSHGRDQDEVNLRAVGIEKDGIAAAGSLVDDVAHYDEISAARGALGRFPGCEIFKILKWYS